VSLLVVSLLVVLHLWNLNSLAILSFALPRLLSSRNYATSAQHARPGQETGAATAPSPAAADGRRRRRQPARRHFALVERSHPAVGDRSQ